MVHESDWRIPDSLWSALKRGSLHSHFQQSVHFADLIQNSEVLTFLVQQGQM
jgi:hypothetical protein